MAQDKKHITPENITEWLSSTGFLFPKNEIELERFEKLYGDSDYGLSGTEIDPEKIIKGTFIDKKTVKLPEEIRQHEIEEYRMAARNGKGLPKHIMDKIVKNQNKSKDDSPSKEGTDK